MSSRSIKWHPSSNRPSIPNTGTEALSSSSHFLLYMWWELGTIDRSYDQKYTQCHFTPQPYIQSRTQVPSNISVPDFNETHLRPQPLPKSPIIPKSLDPHLLDPMTPRPSHTFHLGTPWQSFVYSLTFVNYSMIRTT